MNEIAEIVENRLSELSLSPIKAASQFGLPRDAIRGILRGREPTYSRLKEVCQALGLEFHIGSPEKAQSQSAPPRETIPVLGMAACGKDGWASLGHNDFKATLPDREMSAHSFAVIATGDSMQPYGIYPGAICYCDPKASVRPGSFIFIEKRVGRGKHKKIAMTIKRLIGINEAGDIRICGYRPAFIDEEVEVYDLDSPYAYQNLYDEIVEKQEIVSTAVVCWINTNPVL